MKKRNRSLGNGVVKASSATAEPEVVAASGSAAEDQAVQAAGTSAGVKKGWYSRSKNGTTHHHMHGENGFYSVHQVGDFLDRWTAGVIGHDMAPKNIGGVHESAEAAKRACEMHDSYGSGPAKASSPEDNEQVVHCKSSGVALPGSAKWELDVPVQFQWLPGGTTTIVAHYGSSPIELTVHCDQQAAGVVQASYEQWLGRSRQEPFGCIEHREEEAAIRLPKGIGRFVWKDEPEPGIFCTAVPTDLGAKNVNGRVHRAWSPSFTTDADYASMEKQGNCLVFPDGVRGSASNPARVTGVAFSVGSLTNKPAFKNILPVRAKQASGEQAIEAKGEDAEGLRSVAREHSANAYSASKVALGSGKANLHRNAMKLHSIARKAHQKAADGYYFKEDMRRSDHHTLEAEKHKNKFDEHEERLFRINEGATKASEPSLDEAIMASVGGPAKAAAMASKKANETGKASDHIHAAHLHFKAHTGAFYEQDEHGIDTKYAQAHHEKMFQKHAKAAGVSQEDIDNLTDSVHDVPAYLKERSAKASSSEETEAINAAAGEKQFHPHAGLNKDIQRHVGRVARDMEETVGEHARKPSFEDHAYNGSYSHVQDLADRIHGSAKRHGQAENEDSLQDATGLAIEELKSKTAHMHRKERRVKASDQSLDEAIKAATLMNDSETIMAASNEFADAKRSAQEHNGQAIEHRGLAWDAKQKGDHEGAKSHSKIAEEHDKKAYELLSSRAKALSEKARQTGDRKDHFRAWDAHSDAYHSSTTGHAAKHHANLAGEHKDILDSFKKQDPASKIGRMINHQNRTYEEESVAPYMSKKASSSRTAKLHESVASSLEHGSPEHKAHTASAKAFKTGEAEDHAAAAKAHAKAADSQSTGQSENEHRVLSEMHSIHSGGIKASDQSLDEAITAATLMNSPEIIMAESGLETARQHLSDASNHSAYGNTDGAKRSADKLSIIANETGSREAHCMASIAHSVAANAHDPNIGGEDNRSYHEEKALYHRKMATNTPAKASDSSLDEAIRAAVAEDVLGERPVMAMDSAEEHEEQAKEFKKMHSAGLSTGGTTSQLKAFRASEEAHKLSAAAIRSDDYEDHKKAAASHLNAARLQTEHNDPDEGLDHFKHYQSHASKSWKMED